MKPAFLFLSTAILGCNATKAAHPTESDATSPVTSALIAPVASTDPVAPIAPVAPRGNDAGQDAAHDATGDAGSASNVDGHLEGTVRFLVERVDISHERGQQSKGPFDLVILVEAAGKKPARRHLHCPPRKRLMWENCDTYKSCEVIDASEVVCDGARFSLGTREGTTEVVRGANVELTLDHAYAIGAAQTRVRVAFVDF